MNDIYDFLKKRGTYYLATVEGDQPRVRPFGTADSYQYSNVKLQLILEGGKILVKSKRFRLTQPKKGPDSRESGPFFAVFTVSRASVFRTKHTLRC